MRDAPRVVIARELLAAGFGPLSERYEVVSGGLSASREEVEAMLPGAAAFVPDPSVAVDAELLATAGPELRVVANFAVGYDNIDLGACRDSGVVVTNTPDVLTNATAELAVALTLAAARRLPGTERDLRAGRWEGWDPGGFLGYEIAGSTVGIVGLGRIGIRFAELLGGFGPRLLHHSRSPKPEAEERLGIVPVGLEELLATADVVSLHAPASPETHHLIGADQLALMKPTAILVNTSRGTLVDLDALAEALGEGTIAGAGLDVYEGEPAVPDAIREAPNTALTPHIGSATQVARDGMARTVAANVIAVLEGDEPPNRIA